MKDSVLSIKQCKHLQKLGLDMSDARIWWCAMSHDSKGEKIRNKKYFLSLSENHQKLGFMEFEHTPTYTLQEILEKLPPSIDWYTLQLETYDKCIGYYRDSRIGGFGSYNAPYTLWEEGGEDKPILESAYKLLCWVIEHGHLKTK